MNGPDHYRVAEELLQSAADSTTYDEAAGLTALAQVHATLALAAAAAYPAVRDYCGDEARDPREWSAAIS